MNDILDIFFYEAFEKEGDAHWSFLPDTLRAGFTAATIQEAGPREPPAKIVSLPTPSIIPAKGAGTRDALLSKSIGYDHLAECGKRTGDFIWYVPD